MVAWLSLGCGVTDDEDGSPLPGCVDWCPMMEESESGTTSATDTTTDTTSDSTSESGDTGTGETGGAVGPGEFMAGGTIDGVEFSVSCMGPNATLITANGSYDWACQATNPIQLFSVIDRFQIQGGGFATVGEHLLDPTFPGGFVFRRTEDGVEFATSQAENSTMQFTIDVADDTMIAGSGTGAWTQGGVSISLAVAFSLNVDAV